MEAVGPSSPAWRTEGVAASFAQACGAAGIATADYIIGGLPVSLQLASSELRARLTPAFAHLPRTAPGASGRQALTIRVWDSASTGAEPPPRPVVPADVAAGALYHFHEPPLRVAYQPGLDALTVFDADAESAWYWVGDARLLPSWEQACPIRQVLFWWLGSHGYLQVHGGAVGTPDAGALIVGPAGAGKTTTALACVGSDLLYAGDDYVAVTLEPSPHVASLYSSAKVDTSHLRERFPDLLPFVANGDRAANEKAVLYLHEHFPRQTTAGMPLAAVVIPSTARTHGTPRAVRASRAAAFTALGPSTMFQLHTGGAAELALLGALVARLPCYSLELGSELARVPAVLNELLSTL